MLVMQAILNNSINATTMKLGGLEPTNLLRFSPNQVKPLKMKINQGRSNMKTSMEKSKPKHVPT